MATARQIEQYMKDNVGDHVDASTGEVNLTLLAEDAANHFGLPLMDQRPYEIAYVVGTAHEKRLKGKR